jgi:DAPG hydrolase PhiG domain
MKELSTATTGYEELPDGRVELTIEHELIRGVTPSMLVWWFRSFPVGRLDYKGELVSLYRIWHPRDHIRLDMLRRARDGSPGVSTGAKIAICERIGAKPSRVVARVARMDETGLHLVIRRWLLKVADLRHTFEETPEGTRYRSRLVLGSTLPVAGKLLNVVARKRAAKTGKAWLKHNVEEVGNFQFFLPKLYAEQPLSAREYGERAQAQRR